jgi:hypothetical protein
VNIDDETPMPDASETETTTPPPAPEKKRRAPADMPRTALGLWITEQKLSSAAFAQLCAASADKLGYDASYVPSSRSIDDMRCARFYPSLIVARLIFDVTAGGIGLEQWARDQARFGGRRQNVGRR